MAEAVMDERMLERLQAVAAQLDAARGGLHEVVGIVRKGQLLPAPTGLEVRAAVLVQRQFSGSMQKLNMAIQPLDGQPQAGDLVYVVKEFFTTELGSWELDDKEFGVEPWARERYLKPRGAPDYFDDAGGDHHLFGAVIGEDGELKRNFPFMFSFPDGLNRPVTKEQSGWACVPVYSKYAPDQGERGAWVWHPRPGEAEGVAEGRVFVEKMEGGSLPWGRHVSMFAVWQEVRVS